MRSEEMIALLLILGVGAAVLLMATSPKPAAAALTPLGGPATLYNNDEEWTISRDPRTHRILNINIHRDARIAAAR